MRKVIFTLFFTLILCGVSQAKNNNVIEPELQTILNQKSDELIDIQIYFKSSLDSKQLNQATRKAYTKSEKKEIVVNKLKAYSKNVQADVMSILEAEELSGNVSDIHNLWITSSISCKASASVVYKLSSHPDVKMIGYDKEFQLISPEQMEEIKSAAKSGVRAGGPDTHVQAVEAHRVWWDKGYTGKNVVVAVLDSGTNTNHLDLKDHLWKGYIDTDDDGTPDTYVNGWNFISNNSNITDDYGHGTHCAGIVCGDGTSTITTGIAPDASLMTIKTINRAGGGSVTQMLNGVQFAVENGADVISMSLGFKNSQLTTAQKEEIRAAFDNVLAANVVVCAAAGNDGDTYGAPDNVDYPAACPAPWRNPDQTLEGGLSSVICVGAHDLNESSRGPSTWEGTSYNDYPYDNGAQMGLIRPDISAPGYFIRSTKYNSNDTYEIKNGTSQATPCVAGVIALMLEKNSTLTPAQISQIIEETATSKPATKNNSVGAGVVNALAAVNSITEIVENPYVKATAFAPNSMATGNRTLSITLKNQGSGASDGNTSVTLSLSNDPYVTIANPTQTLGRLDVNVDKTLFFELNIDENTPSGHTATFSVKTTSGTLSWEDTYSVQIAVPNLAYQSVSPGLVNTNATTDIKVTMVNNGSADFTGPITLKLVTTSYDLKNVTLIDSVTTIPALGVGETGTGTFTIETKTPTYPYDFFLETYSESTTSSNYIYEFENDMEGWTCFNASSNDNVKSPWFHSTDAITFGKEAKDSHSGNGHLMSRTLLSNNMSYSFPINNYLVSPVKMKVTEYSKVSFYARAHMEAYYPEHFGLAVSTTGNTSEADFTLLDEWVITEKETSTTWKQYTVDLSAYAGQEIYVAIRHFFTDEEWNDSFQADFGFGVDALNVDDILFENVIVNTEYKSTYDSNDPYHFNVTASSNPSLPMVGTITATPMSGAVSLEWDAVDGVSKYGVYRDGQRVATVTEPSYVDEKLSYTKQYCYAVTTITNYESGFSEEVCATTLEPKTKPEVPANLSAKAISVSEILLTWDVAVGARTYNVYQGEEVIQSGITETTYTVTGLTEQTYYCFKVIAVNEMGNSEMSEEACATTLKHKPATPANLIAETTSDSEIVLTWNAATGASTYKVYQDTEEIASEITETTYTVTGLTAQTNYCFNVIAVNEAGDSKMSEETCEITMRAKPEVPANLIAEANGYSEIVLTWDATDRANSYKVCQDTGTDVIVIASEITDTTYTVSGLTEQTNYCFNVIAVNETGESEMSNSACTMTGKEPTGIIVKSFELDAHNSATTLTVTLINKTTSDVTAEAMAVAKLSCDDPYVTINNGEANVGALAVGETTDVTFNITLAYNIPFEHVLDFDINVEYQVSEMSASANLSYTFNNDLEGFTTITGDDHNWYHSSNQSAHGYDKEYKTGGFIFSESYCNKGSGFDPDHWIVLPEQIIPSDLTRIEFYACSMSSYNTYADETFGVFVSTTSNTDTTTFTKINSWTLDKNQNSLKMALKSAMLRDYKDQKIWVAIRHYGDGDNAALAVDDVTIYNINKKVTNIVTDTSSFSATVISPFNTFSGNGTWNDESMWSKGSVPTAEEDIVIAGDITIENGNVTAKSIIIDGGSLTVKSGAVLTVNETFINTDASAFIIEDGAQVVQGNDDVMATFLMNVEAPNSWEENHTHGWQFIASPMKDFLSSEFETEGIEYDLFKYDGTQEMQWVNYKGHADTDFETKFYQGRAYLASYETSSEVAFEGTLNHETNYTFSEFRAYDEGNHYANFYLLGNPFTFDMNWNNMLVSDMSEGYAVVNLNGAYEYAIEGEIKVGDGFLVRVTGSNPSMTYTSNMRSVRTEKNEFINLVASGKAGKDNVIINFADNGREGFAKLDNFNKEIAEIYVKEDNRRYGILNFENDLEEIDVYFDAKQMGEYTINAITGCEYQSVTLVDLITGNETDLLASSYTFKSMTNESAARFKLRIERDKETENFVYQSGDELIIEAEGTVQIIDVMGRIVLSKEINGNDRINIGKLNKAAYIVRCIENNNVKTQKIALH